MQHSGGYKKLNSSVSLSPYVRTKSMASLEEVVQSLQFENSQLRTELKAQQTVNLKLRKEKADVSLALQDSKEEKR